MFIICADVVGRYIFNAPIRGAAEMVGYSIVTAVFLQFANTLHVGRFTRSDMLIERLEGHRPAAGYFFNAVFDALGVAVFAAIAYGTYPKLQHAWRTDEITGTPGDFTFIIWPFLAVIVFGAAVTTIEFAIRFVASARRAWLAAARPAPGDGSGWPWIAGFLVLVAAGWLVATSGLSASQVGILGIVSLLVLIYAGMPIGVVMIVLGFLGVWIIRGDPDLGVRVLSRSSTEYLKNYFFGVVPLFVLMGLLVSVSDVGRDTFDVARWVLRRVRGGLGVATVLANAIFASITGSSIASAAVFTKIATPEMLRHGYTPRFSVGVVAGSSVLGMLIPPSLLLIIYGFIAEQSVGHLFLAAIVPGLVLAGAMALLIVLLATFWPAFIGGSIVKEEELGISVPAAALKLTPIVALVALVLGGIYGGVFTPTEAGAAGALGALVIAILRRKLSWRKLWATMVETGYVTVSVLFLLLGARVFGQMLAMSNMPQQMSALAAGADLGLTGFIALYLVVVVLLGTILDSVSIMVITLPFVLPVVQHLGGDLIWFGVVSVVAVEIGLLTPPFGISCYVVKSTLDDRRITINQIFAGAFPFVIVMLLVVALLVAVPRLSLLFQ
ncbi:MAG: TRAP transporter large permease subunit [Betaproteobacteria bacterium]|jgi:tripartite ATP-independent transporter DctM subunit|nr:TRAP transporter large permease subunit [Betaproteobacteria bacterium]